MTTAAGYRGLLLKKSFWLFTGRAMPIIVLFLITILYSRKLSYEDYGKFQSIWMYANLLNIIISFGITSVLLSSNLSLLVTFIKRHFTKIISAYLLLTILSMSVFFWYAKIFSSSTKFLIILFVMMQCISVVSETLLIKSHKERVVFFINLIYSFLFFGWHYYILLKTFDLNHLIEGIIVLSLLKFLIMLFIKKKHDVVSESVNDKIYFNHWIFLGLNDITGVLSRWIDKLVLVYLLTPPDFAVFFNGSFEIPLFGLLVSVIASVMLIEASKTISSKEKVMGIFIESFRLLSLIVFPLFLFFLFYRNELFAVVFKHKYDASVSIFVISIFILPARINNYSSILQYYQKGNKILTGTLLDISIAVILMLVMYPILGTRGVALAIVTSTYCQVIYYLWQTAKALNTDILSLIPIKNLAKTFGIMMVMFAILYFSLLNVPDIIKLVAAIIATTLFILTGLYFYFKKQHFTVYGLTEKT